MHNWSIAKIKRQISGGHKNQLSGPSDLSIYDYFAFSTLMKQHSVTRNG
jgi:hypothetical protein